MPGRSGGAPQQGAARADDGTRPWEAQPVRPVRGGAGGSWDGSCAMPMQRSAWWFGRGTLELCPVLCQPGHWRSPHTCGTCHGTFGKLAALPPPASKRTAATATRAVTLYTATSTDTGRVCSTPKCLFRPPDACWYKCARQQLGVVRISAAPVPTWSLTGLHVLGYFQQRHVAAPVGTRPQPKLGHFLDAAPQCTARTLAPHTPSVTARLLNMPQSFPAVQPGGSLILAWQVKGKKVLVVGGGEVSAAQMRSRTPSSSFPGRPLDARQASPQTPKLIAGTVPRLPPDASSTASMPMPLSPSSARMPV